jgi:DNA-binding GntR family transcriptional regulator
MQFSMRKNMQKTTQTQKVLKELESAIVSGYFKPRERLIETDLDSRFNCSRTVIRDVFKILESKGLIHIQPYKGAQVSDLSPQEIEDIYFLRSHLERISAKLILENITQDEIRKLKIRAEKAESALRSGGPNMVQEDQEFHRFLFQITRNTYLNNFIEHLRLKSYIVSFNAWIQPDRIEQSVKEHKEIILSIEKKSLARLEKLLVQHLTFSKECYLVQLKRLETENVEYNSSQAKAL